MQLTVTQQLSIAVILACSTLLTGCILPEKVKEVSVQEVPSNIQRVQQVEKAILIAGQGLNWTMDKTETNQILATQAASRTRIVVLINYSAGGYNITLKEATNMSYNAEKGTISPSYNQAITDLDNAIQVNLYGR